MRGKLKVYVCANLDGENSAAVAAHNLKEAARLLNTTIGQMRKYGWGVVKNQPNLTALVMEEPGRIVFRPLSIYGEIQGWGLEPKHKRKGLVK